MATIQITQVNFPSSLSSLQDALSTFDETKFVLGTKIQDEKVAQLTTSPPAAPPASLGTPLAIHTARLNAPFFGADNPGSAPVIEYVLIYFANSRITPEFRKRIEIDFAAFDVLAKKGARGDIGVASGWVDESLTHESIQEPATGYLVARGWEAMEDFENVLKTVEYAEAIPLLLAWEAPFEMVSMGVYVVISANWCSGMFS
jgi:hypothetical protein